MFTNLLLEKMSDTRDVEIVLFKSVSESENETEDNYRRQFVSAGFQVTLVPVLDFQFINLDLLLNKLKCHDDYAGIIFSSPRCVTGVELSLKEGNKTEILDGWKQHKNFVVGPTTAKIAENLGLVVDGKEAGNGIKLAEIISKENYMKPFLYPKGSLTQDNFKLKLKENDIQTDDIVIYETVPHSKLKSNILNIKGSLGAKTFIFVYFSPSGIKFTLPILQELHFEIGQIKFVAIGPTTEAALVENGLSVAATSLKPDPFALLEAVLSLRIRS